MDQAHQIARLLGGAATRPLWAGPRGDGTIQGNTGKKTNGCFPGQQARCFRGWFTCD
ncbi:MAG: hypothetical protein ACR2J8_05750 [Thermomicrobiales bacterium]